MESTMTMPNINISFLEKSYLVFRQERNNDQPLKLESEVEFHPGAHDLYHQRLSVLFEFYEYLRICKIGWDSFFPSIMC